MTKQITQKTSQKRKLTRPRKLRLEDQFIREVHVHYRATAKKRFKIGESADVASFLREVATDNSREHFFALFLDGSHHVASYSLVSLGCANSCQIHPREIFQRAIVAGATSLIVAHNHPSGSLMPSEADWAITKRIFEISSLLSIPLLDHVIFADSCEFSMRGEARWPQSGPVLV